MAGYQAIIIGGVREPYIIRQLDSWLAAMQEKFAARVQEMFGGRLGPDDYDIHVRVYGRDGVMGKLEPKAHEVGHEIGLLFTITTAEEGATDAIAKTFAHFALHYPIPEWRGLISGIAFPMAPRARQSRAGLPVQPQPHRGAGQPDRDVPHRIPGGVNDGHPGRARAPDPLEERRAVHADVRRDVRQRGRPIAGSSPRAC